MSGGDEKYSKLGKALVLVVLLALSISFAQASDVFYEVNDTSEGYNLSTTIQLECDEDSAGCPTSRWSLSWDKPENSEVLLVENNYGEIDSYRTDNGLLTVESSEGSRTNNQTFRMVFKVEEDREGLGGSLERRPLNLPGYAGSKTSGKVRADDFLTASASSGTKTGLDNGSLAFESEGPLNLRLNFGDGEELAGYSYFANVPLNETTSRMAYETALGVTSTKPKYNFYPVVIKSPEVYQAEHGLWSSGEYSEGVITIRDDLDDRTTAVLAHETVHAINHEAFEWSRSESAYIDEGLATYTEFLVNKRMYREELTDNMPPQLFGESIEYTERQGSDIIRYELPPQGDKEQLWHYYEENQSFMKQWHPKQEENREFGYAYSQLIIRNYVKNGGDLNTLYQEFKDIEREFGNEEDKWNTLDEVVDLEPCNYDSREQFDSCIKEINDYDYEILVGDSFDQDDGSGELDVDNIELEEREKPETVLDNENVYELLKISQDIQRVLNEALQRFLENFKA